MLRKQGQSPPLPGPFTALPYKSSTETTIANNMCNYIRLCGITLLAVFIRLHNIQNDTNVAYSNTRSTHRGEMTSLLPKNSLRDNRRLLE